MWFFWTLPGWFFYLNFGEIAILYAYVSVTNFLESLLVFCIPLGLSFILPKQWFRDKFVSRGASLVLLGLGYLMLVAYQFKTRDDYPGVLLKLWSVTLALVVISLLVFAVEKIPFIKKAIEFIAEQSTIFLFIYIPLSLISLLIVLPRIL